MSAIAEYSPYSPIENGSAATLFSRLNEEPKQNLETRGTNVDGISCIPVRILGFTLKEITDIVLQVFGAIIASVFGVWAIKSYDSTNFANGLAVEALQQSLLANKIALASLCLENQFSSTPECAHFLQEFSMPSIIHAVIPSSTTILVTSATSVIATFSGREASSTLSPIISTIFPAAASSHSLTFDTTKLSASTHNTDTFSTSDFIGIGPSSIFPNTFDVPTITAFTVPSITTNFLFPIASTVASSDLPRSTTVGPPSPITSTSASSSPLRKNITLSFGVLIGIMVSAIVLISIMGIVLVGRRRARMLKMYEAAL